MTKMKATVLTDNTPGCGLDGEWGLSVYIQLEGTTVLLDVGASGLFLKNAQGLGLDIQAVDCAVLSHAHRDHADGMEPFFQANDHAKFYLRRGSEIGSYAKKFIFYQYVGIPRHILERHPDRAVLVDGDYHLCPGAWLIPHKTPGLDQIGRRNKMYLKAGTLRWRPDDFCHEQSLVIETEEGLAVFNSCSHGGVDNIIREVEQTFPDKPIRAMIGGFHLYDKPEEEVRALARRIRALGPVTLYTGHCTGPEPFQWLQDELGSAVKPLAVGLVIEM